jgi:hypothetical protein
MITTLLLTTLLMQTTHTVSAPQGAPAWLDIQADTSFDAAKVRVLSNGKRAPAKVEHRGNQARVSWLSLGPGQYTIDQGGDAISFEPAMIGTGDRVTFGRPGVRGRLAVGLYAQPGAVDKDSDGDLDLIVNCSDRPYNGIYLFTNVGTNEKPLFSRALWLGPAKKDPVVADMNGDGAPDLVYSLGYFDDIRRNRLTKPIPLKVPRDYHVGRDDLWHPVDWNGDGKVDLLNGVSDWREYGWDDAYDEQGVWRRGPLHGYVYLWLNEGTNQEPVFTRYTKLPIDQYGTPAPSPLDWDSDGKLDLVLSNFIDQVWLWKPGQSAPKPFPFRMELCMIQARALYWLRAGVPSLLVGEEGGHVALAHRGENPQYLEQIDPYVKSRSLSRPVAFDWNGDGKLDLLAGNSAGFIQYFENTGTAQQPAFIDHGNLEADGKVIRRMAGTNGSVQGPAEEKWGYSNISVADWDLDGLPDILLNDIWGDVVWFRNIGSRTNPKLAAAESIEVEWKGPAPKPNWVWWQPKPKQLLTQWRTTPKVIDWDRDGLPDLVMLDYRGYLALYRRAKQAGKLVLLPPERIFVEPSGRFLTLAAGNAGRSGRRKIELVDWDGDGKLDLVSDSDEGPIWYRNIGTMDKPVLKPEGTILKAKLAGHNPTPNVADWNGDGKLDLLVGAEDGFFYFFDRRYIEAQR